MENKPSCYSCIFREPTLGIYGIECVNRADRFFPMGVPEELICDRYKRENGISIRDKYPDKVQAYRVLMMAENFSDEFIDAYLDKDSALVE